MEKLNFELRNCYGINYLNDSFNFREKNIFSIYAPNGTMKTSFAKTFLRISESKSPRDDLHGLESEFSIKTEVDSVQTDIDSDFKVLKQIFFGSKLREMFLVKICQNLGREK